MSVTARVSMSDLPPMPFLRELAARIDPGARVLDLACGAGRHAKLFAERGCRVLAVDSSVVALDLIDSSVIKVVCAALEFEIAEGAYDLIVVTMFLDRKLFPKIRASVSTGGRVAMAIPLLDDREGVKPMNPEYLLKPGELAVEFSEEDGWVLEHRAETMPDPPTRRVAELIACRK